MEEVNEGESRLERRRRAAREYQRKIREDPKVIEQHRLYRQTESGKVVTYKQTAKRMKREWSLTRKMAYAFFRSSCHYCGVPPNPLNGIDRKDNSQGYIEENCLPCCSTCNYAKRTMSYADFLAWIDRITKFRGDTDLKLQLIAKSL